MLDVFTRFNQGGSFMWVILFVGAWILAVAIDRFVVLFLKSSVNGKVVMDQIERFMTAGDSASALKYCNSLEGKPLVKVLKAGISNVNSSFDLMNSSMDEAMLEVLPKLQKRTAYLFNLANIATLLGLMGTIAGLIESFGSLDINDPASQARQLGSGISMAMLTTEFGLVVAVPAILIHQIIQNKTEQIVEEIDHYSTKLVNLITRQKSAK